MIFWYVIKHKKLFNKSFGIIFKSFFVFELFQFKNFESTLWWFMTDYDVMCDLWKIADINFCHYDLYFWSKTFVSVSSLYKWNINDLIQVMLSVFFKGHIWHHNLWCHRVDSTSLNWNNSKTKKDFKKVPKDLLNNFLCSIIIFHPGIPLTIYYWPKRRVSFLYQQCRVCMHRLHLAKVSGVKLDHI